MIDSDKVGGSRWKPVDIGKEFSQNGNSGLVDPVVVASNAEVNIFPIEDRSRLLRCQMEGNALRALSVAGGEIAILILRLVNGKVRSIHQKFDVMIAGRHLDGANGKKSRVNLSRRFGFATIGRDLQGEFTLAR